MEMGSSELAARCSPFSTPATDPSQLITTHFPVFFIELRFWFWFQSCFPLGLFRLCSLRLLKYIIKGQDELDLFALGQGTIRLDVDLLQNVSSSGNVTLLLL